MQRFYLVGIFYHFQEGDSGAPSVSVRNLSETIGRLEKYLFLKDFEGSKATVVMQKRLPLLMNGDRPVSIICLVLFAPVTPCCVIESKFFPTSPRMSGGLKRTGNFKCHGQLSDCNVCVCMGGGLVGCPGGVVVVVPLT